MESTPLYFTYPITNYDIKDICCATINTVVLTKRNKIYVLGAKDFEGHDEGFIPNGGASTPIPTLLYDGEKNGMEIKSLFCAGKNTFFFDKKNSLFGFGFNNHGEVCSGDKERIEKPIKIIHEFTGTFDSAYGLVTGYYQNNSVSICGTNLRYHFGDLTGKYDGFFEYVKVKKGDYATENSSISILHLFHTGGLMYFESGELYYWGESGFFIQTGIPQLNVLNPTKLDFYEPRTSISRNSTIRVVSCLNACFVVLDEYVAPGIFLHSRIYSWGTSLRAYLARVALTEEEVRIPSLIDYGDIRTEYIIDMAYSSWHVYFLSDDLKVFAIGLNRFGNFENEVEFRELVFMPLRILKTERFPAFIKGVSEFRVGQKEIGHFLVIIKNPFDQTFWIFLNVLSAITGIVGGTLLVICIIVMITIVFFKFLKKRRKSDVVVEEELRNIIMKENKYEGLRDNDLFEMFDKSFKKSSENFQGFKKSFLAKCSKDLKGVFMIKYEDIKLHSFISSGGSGASVFDATYKGRKVAFKSFPFVVSSESTDYSSFLKEVSIFLLTNHKNVLEFIGCVLEENHIGLLMSFCEHGDCRTFLTTNAQLSMKERIRISYEISLGMLHLDTLNIIHRDLKPTNILIDENFSPRIMDFGLSRTITNSLTKTVNIGTQNYQAPELILSGKYTNKVDVFAYAIVMYQILSGNFNPFNENKYGENVNVEILKNPNYRPDLSVFKELDVPKWLITIMKNAWDHVPGKRPSFESIVHSFEIEFDMEEKSKIKIRKPITIYFKMKDSEDDPVDFEFNKFTIEELRRLVENWKSVLKFEKMKLYLKSNEITCNEDLESLEEDDVIEVDIEDI